jgi:hypothetical protein
MKDAESKGGLTAAMFVARTKGKARGFTEHLTIETNPVDEKYEFIKNLIMKRADQKGISYEDELRHYLGTEYAKTLYPEVREKLEEELV